jgi:UDP-glucose:(heptosyl)LPS alpha-1,3-glucosyltransferase
VASEHPVSDSRSEGSCNERCRSGNEAIEQHRYAARCALNVVARHCRDFQATDLCEPVDAIGRLARLCANKRALYHLDLAGTTRIVEPGTMTNDIVGRCMGQRTHQTRRGSGVADAHVTGNQQVSARFCVGGRVRCSDTDCAFRFGARHGRASSEIRGTRTHPRVGHAIQRNERICNANVDNREARAQSTSKHVDRRAATREIGHHLRGDFRWIGRHAASGDAMVCGEYGDRRAQWFGNGAILSCREPASDIFEATERGTWLCKSVLARTRSRSGIHIRKGQGRHDAGHFTDARSRIRAVMRIAVIRQRYNPYGGAERFVARALDALSAQGAEVTIVARGWREGGGSMLRVDPFYLGRLWRDWGFARAVCARTAPNQFDLVQSHERLTCCDIYRAGDGVHRQWLENRARAASAMARLATRLSPYHRYVLAAEARMFTCARLRAVICNSRMVRDEIRRHFGVADDKLHVIYSGVDLEVYSPALRAAHRVTMRDELGIPHDAMVYLHVGSGFARKGVEQLLGALARMRRNDARLLVVGHDKNTARVRRRATTLGIEDRVHFVGGQADVKPWYGVADCFVLATLYDPFPNAALEALATGLPVVVSRQCGAAELVEEGANGFVREALDIDGFTQAMTVVADRGAPSMRDAARQSVAHLGLDAMGAQLVALYRKLLAE